MHLPLTVNLPSVLIKEANILCCWTMRLRGRNSIAVAATALVVAQFVTIICWDVVAGIETGAFPKEALPTESGYLDIEGKSGARMFYAYYEAISPEKQLSDTPILLWLQGGPGCSGMIGNFYELGPWRVSGSADHRLHQNPAPWNRAFGLLFLDNPLGSGFSIAPSEEHIPAKQDEVAKDLYAALQAFFDLNPLFRKRPFYVTGESYAGKYVPSLSLYMLNQLDNNGVLPLRLDGLAIGNGLVHPVVQVQSHASVAYALGLIDAQEKFHLEALQQEAANLTRQQKWQDALIARSRVLKRLENVTGLATLYDMRRTLAYYTSENGTEYLSLFLNQPAVKEALKVDGHIKWEDCSQAVGQRMGEDVMKSSKWMVEALVRRRPVLLYQGQFDLQDGVVSTEGWISLLDWEGLDNFLASKRSVWKVSNKLAGYVRSHSNLTHVVVAGSGHLVPADQNLHSQMMIESWVSRGSLSIRSVVDPFGMNARTS